MLILKMLSGCFVPFRVLNMIVPSPSSPKLVLICLSSATQNESLVKRRGKKRAIIAIARMILTAIYQMLSTGEVWNLSDLYKIDMPETLVEKQKAKAINQAKKLLQMEGLLPPDEPLAS